MSRRHAIPRPDLLVAAGLAAVGWGFWFWLRSHPIGMPLFGVTPGSFPTGLALMIGGVSVLLVVALALRPPAPRPADDEAGGLAGALRLVALFGLCLGFAVGLREIGFLLAGGMLVLGTALLFGARSPVLLAALTIGAPLALQVFFEKAMVIFLPVGRLWQ